MPACSGLTDQHTCAAHATTQQHTTTHDVVKSQTQPRHTHSFSLSPEPPPSPPELAAAASLRRVRMTEHQLSLLEGSSVENISVCSLLSVCQSATVTVISPQGRRFLLQLLQRLFLFTHILAISTTGSARCCGFTRTHLSPATET